MPTVEVSKQTGEVNRPLIAVTQYAPEYRKIERNREQSKLRIHAATKLGASLVILPECCITGLVFEDRAELLEVAESLDGPTVACWQEMASRAGIYVIGGIAERNGESLFNTAVMIAPDGTKNAYRKTHVFGQERKLFSLGDRLVCVDTKWGRVGLAICYDLWFPEVTRALAKNGASLIAAPSNWFVPPRQALESANAIPMAVHLASAAACSNEVTIACSDRIGEEGGVSFIGGSFIIGPNGRPLAGPAARETDDCLMAYWPDPILTKSLVQSHLDTRREHLYAQPVTVYPTRGDLAP